MKNLSLEEIAEISKKISNWKRIPEKTKIGYSTRSPVDRQIKMSEEGFIGSINGLSIKIIYRYDDYLKEHDYDIFVMEEELSLEGYSTEKPRADYKNGENEREDIRTKSEEIYKHILNSTEEFRELLRIKRGY